MQRRCLRACTEIFCAVLSHAFGHTNLLRRAGGGKRLDNSGLEAVLPKLLRDVLATLVGTPTNNTAPQGDGCRSDEQLKRLKSLVLAGQQIYGGSPSLPVGYIAGVPKVTYGHWREGPRYVPVVQLERPDDLAVGCLGVSKLLRIPHGINVAVRDSPPNVIRVSSRLVRTPRLCPWI